MQELLPKYGVRLVEIPRLTLGPSTSSGTERASVGEWSLSLSNGPAEPANQEPVSASCVRKALDEGRFRVAAALTPASTWPYLLADLAERALRMELDTPLKPGLVGPDSVGAHADMDYALMRKGIAAIRPFFPRMAMAASAEELRQLGIDAEQAMLAATGGVNTHRGAIFALGLALNAAGRRMEGIESERFMQSRVRQLAQSLFNKSLTDSELHSTASSHGGRAVKAHGVKGAMQMALEGYRELFESWLPYFRTVSADKYGLQRLLLKIMSELDDTCVIHRVGYERAQQVKAEAKALPGTFSFEDLQEMNRRYAAEGISPGGAADMLALTIFLDSILN
jgi:triphosphoribosyl-dephospho-CoA synthetase